MTTSLAILSTVALLTATALAAPAWHDDFEAARRLAEQEQKDLLLDFTGSDWCVWCTKLKEEVFDHEVFQRGVADKFVLVEIDFPRDESILSEATRKQNEELERAYAIRAYPSIVLCDAAGRPYAQTGYQAGGPEAYLKHLDEERAKRAVRDAAFAKVAQAEGGERAAALEAALELVPRETLGTLYKSEFDELGTLAPDSALVNAVRAAAKSDRQRNEFRDFFTRQDFEGAVSHADALIAKQKLDGEAKQEVLFYKLNAFVAMDRHDEALAVAEQIREIAPESRFGSGVDRLRQHLKTLKEGPAKENPEGAADKSKGAPVEKKSTSFAPLRSAYRLIADEKPAGEEAPNAEAKPAANPGMEKELRAAVAQARKELGAVSGRIDTDHGRLEKLVPTIAESKARLLELRAALAMEEAKLAAMNETVAKIENAHNRDHDQQEALAKQLAERVAALEKFEAGQGEVTKLEKQAAALREKAEQLRRRAEELKKN